MKHIRLRNPVLVLADIFKPGRGSVVPVRDDHIVLHEKRTDFTPFAIGVFGPYLSHPEITAVELLHI